MKIQTNVQKILSKCGTIIHCEFFDSTFYVENGVSRLIEDCSTIKSEIKALFIGVKIYEDTPEIKQLEITMLNLVENTYDFLSAQVEMIKKENSQ